MKKLQGITEDEIAMFTALAKLGMSRREISEHTGRSTRTLDRYLPKGIVKTRYDHTQHLTTVRNSPPVVTDHEKHLTSINDAHKGLGFPVSDDEVIAKFYALEVARRRDRDFWRAA